MGTGVLLYAVNKFIKNLDKLFLSSGKQQTHQANFIYANGELARYRNRKH